MKRRVGANDNWLQTNHKRAEEQDGGKEQDPGGERAVSVRAADNHPVICGTEG